MSTSPGSRRGRERDLVGARGAGARDAPAEARDERVVAIDLHAAAGLGRVDLDDRRGVHGERDRPALRCEPQATRALDDQRADAARGDELLEERARDRPRRGVRFGERAHVEEQIVELVGVAHGGRGLGGDAREELGVEPADALGDLGRQAAAHGHGARPALLERRVVEERVRVRGEELVREHARLRSVSRRTTSISPRASASSTRRAPAASIHSTRQSRSVSKTSG